MKHLIYVMLRRLRAPLILLVLTYAVSTLGFVLIPGQTPDGQPYRMDFFHAFYFVSFMGSTIGFGEIPYPFTTAQRLWAMASIYATVVAWLYAIGATLSIVQDPAFRRTMKRNTFVREVNNITEPFYLVCGYGDTGALLVKALADAGIRSVVVDVDEERVNAAELEDLRVDLPAYCADAADPDVLGMAGLKHHHCAGVVALTNQDQINLTIAITATLMRPGLRTIARAETHDGAENIASLGDIEVINPFDTFAGRLALALHAPSMFLLFEWLTGVPHERLRQPLFPPRGHWILCGYGRFGKAVAERLEAEGVDIQIIEAETERTGAPSGTVRGVGTDAATLLEARVESAAGIVAGTDNDANNLSIIITARDLNEDLFCVARQNQSVNQELFDAAELDLVMRRGSVIAHKIFALITTPLLDHFLEEARSKDNEWASELVSRVSGVVVEEAPRAWAVIITPARTPALARSLADDEPVILGDLLRHPRDRERQLPCIALLLRREDGETLLLPDNETRVRRGDRLLLCGRESARGNLAWITQNEHVLGYVRTGEEHPSSLLGRLLSGAR